MECKKQTAFEEFVAVDPHLYDVVNGFAKKIKANLEYNLPIIESDIYVLPSDNKLETARLKHYFHRVMVREINAITDFTSGIVKILGEILDEYDFGQIVKKDYQIIIHKESNGLVFQFLLTKGN